MNLPLARTICHWRHSIDSLWIGLLHSLFGKSVWLNARRQRFLHAQVLSANEPFRLGQLV